MTITMLDALVKVDACNEARRWVESYRPRAVRARDYWTACERGDWLLWVASRAGVDRRDVVRAACACARLSLVHVPAGEPRPLRAIETAERWARGKATIEEVRAAYDAASAAARYAAYYYAAAAYDAAAAASASASAAASAAAVLRHHDAGALRQCADLVRQHIRWEDVDRGLYLAAGGVLP